MKDCFAIEKIYPGISLITEPYYREHANLFIVEGKSHDLLIDAGLGACNIKKFLIARGFSPKVTATHSHFDHIGGLSYFAADDILIPSLSASNMVRRELWGVDFLKSSDFDATATYTVAGKSPEEICKDFSVSTRQIHPIEKTEISVGEYTLKMLPLPGHTDDSSALYDEENGILFTGDTLYDGTPYAGFPNSDIHAFQQSLRYIETLDFKIVFPGHNQILNRTQAMGVIQQWQTLLQKGAG